MSLSDNTQYWIDRERAEVAAILSGEWWVIAAILGGRIPDAEAELAKFDAPRDRALRIGGVLLSEFQVGCSSADILCREP